MSRDVFHFRRALALIVVTLFSAGCGSWDKKADSWNGHNLDEVVSSWGPPATVYDMDNGSRSVVFSHSRINDGTQLYCNVTMNVDSAGVIKSSSVDGNIGGCNRFFGTKDAAP